MSFLLSSSIDVNMLDRPCPYSFMGGGGGFHDDIRLVEYAAFIGSFARI